MLRRSIMIAALTLLATPAAAGWTLPCICRSSRSLLAGQVAGAVLPLLDARKAFVIRCKTTIA